MRDTTPARLLKRRSLLGSAAVGAGLLAALLGVPGGALAQPAPRPAQVAVQSPDIPAANSMAHAQQLQSIATSNGGNRAHGKPGFRASADYVKAKLDAAGFQTTLQSFSYNGSTGYNVIADWPYGDANQIVFLGSHLDSVPAGPGINDNGSGTSAVLETALAVSRANARPTKRLRFGWWGAEELGMIGSKYYVQQLPAAERSKISAYLNFDMVGAKNTRTWGVYTDSSTLGATFTEYFRSKGIGTNGINVGARSDHASFKSAGIQVSGISSGDDPCYHTRCDDINNIESSVLGTATNAAAYAVWKLAGIPATPAVPYRPAA
ncbi:M28 family peptidase [Actinomadura chibensis]|uniref:M20/M25/M40 family metallo-hydrolase n=1 Tax=Actinomadura chibensis TaxID=392828 RepID=A0A5D0NIF4_9ACTN|nr:M28 family peptidase [Actinomadura chibensis]TYB44173.1 M20/M25/M40 family metallo-hydrolase [Actinomadura chibensis]